jgi:hypothetical protein
MSKLTLKSKLMSMHKSFANWFNGVIGSLCLLVPELANSAPAIKEYLPAKYSSYLIGVLIIGNIVIRTFKTKSPIESK